MPGTAKICSMITVAPMSVPRLSATIVSSPKSELGSAWRASTRHGPTPFAFAVTT